MEEITAVELAGFPNCSLTRKISLKIQMLCTRPGEDPALKEMCEDMAQRHTQHYDAILSELK